MSRRSAGSDPMPFPGTVEEQAANLASHDWPSTDDGHDSRDDRCLRCGVKPWYVSARWPCGAEVPRIPVFAAPVCERRRTEPVRPMRADPQAVALLMAVLGATIVEWPPSEPCPCGSGRRFKYCHGSVKS